MRAFLAMTTILLVLATALAPHTHHGPVGTHACVACVTASADEAAPATPAVTPLVYVATTLRVDAQLSPVDGAPIGAISGQSPPASA